MALDFHNSVTNEYLFGLNDGQYASMEEIFQVFKKQTGICINQYDDAQLSVEHQKRIIQLIDVYIKKTDLNMNKQKTIDIIEFRTLMNRFSEKKIDVLIFCD